MGDDNDRDDEDDGFDLGDALMLGALGGGGREGAGRIVPTIGDDGLELGISTGTGLAIDLDGDGVGFEL
jgi:hypothetical protein